MATEGDIRQSQGEWQTYYDSAWRDANAGLVTLLNNMGVTNVTGSGSAMRFHYTTGAGGQESTGTLSRQQFMEVYDSRKQPKAAPGSFAKSWAANMRGIPFPDFRLENPNTNDKMDGTVDPSKVLDAVRAYEAVNGPLPGGGEGKIVPLGEGYDQDIIIGADGKVTKIDKATGAKTSYDPGLSTVGDDLKGYDVLQQRSGQLDPIKQRVDPGYIIDPKTMQPYFQQPDGSLQAAPIPSIDEQISMHLVEGNMDAAVGKANFRDRPTSMEYFNAAMEWARSPADIFTISALVRGIFEPTPGPMGQMRRVGAPPAWATQAWVGLQNSMGIPVESMTNIPGAEPGTVNEMAVASSSGLVPNNFASANSAATTFDGKTVNPSPTEPITGQSTVQALDASGNVVGSMTADTATQQGLEYANKGTEVDFAAAMDTEGVYSGDISAASELTQAGGFGTDLPDRGGRGISMNDGSNATTIESFFNGLDDKQKAFVNQWPGGIWSFASSAQNMAELERNLNFHFQNAPETVGRILPQVDGSFTEITPEGEAQIGALNIGSEVDALAALGGDQTFETITSAEYDTTSPGIGDDEFIELDADRIERQRKEEQLRQAVAERDALFRTEQASTNRWDYDEFGEAVPSQAMTPSASVTPSWLTDYDAEDMGFGPMTGGGQYGGQYGGLPAAAGSGLDFQGPYGMDIPSDITSPYDPRTAGYPEAWLTGSEEAGYNVGTNISAPRPGAQQSTIRPEERRWATQASGRQPWETGGMDFIPDEFVPPPTREGRVGGTIRAEDMRAKQEAIARALQPPESEPVPLSQPNYYGAAGGFQEIVPEVAERWYEPYEYEESAPITPVYNQPAPAPVPIYTPPEIFEEDMGFTWSDPEPESAARWYDEGADGMRTRERLSLVGESGPELALFPNGTEIIPLDREMQPDQKRRLRRRGAFANAIDSFEFGGYVGGMGPRVADLPASAQTMPAGITEIMSGRPTRAPRSLMRQAGMRAPSAQTISNLLPEEISVYQEMGRMAGIPDKAFEREFRSMVPMGQGGTRQARFTPRSTGRTRYGAI